MIIRNSVLELIRKNKRLKNRLAFEMDISPSTLNRWIEDNDDSLTKATALKVIQEELGLTQQEILEEESIEANTKE